MKSGIVLLVLLSGMFGSPAGFHGAKSGATQHDVVRDREACEREARQRAAVEERAAGRQSVQPGYEHCLGVRGYEKVWHP